MLWWQGVPSLAQPSLEQKARKILADNCEGCHGQAQMSGLDLRSLETLRKGGKRGPAIVPGHGSESLLFRAVAQNGDVKMPPGKGPLSVADVETPSVTLFTVPTLDTSGFPSGV